MIRRVLAFVSLCLTLGACAPIVQHALRPQPGFAGPRLGKDAFVSFDGARLGLSEWDAQGGEPQVVIVGLHGMNEWAQGFWMAAPWWAQHGITTYAFDQRGFGRSPERGVWGGKALMTEDLRTLCALVRARHPHATIAVAGESMGGAVAIEAFASERPPDADRLILMAPAVWGWSSQPILNRVALWTAAHTIRSRALEAPASVADHITASDNIYELRRMGRDPEMVWGARPDTLYGLVSLMDAAGKDLGRVKVPVFYGYGAHDQLIPRGPSFKAARKLKPADRSAYYPDGWHILMRDWQAERVWGDIEAFARDPAAPLPSHTGPIPGAGGR
ncbi:MAG: lysophospholipase [Proteobacteria bacterium]|nr:lysophospholipase [Pseudomonadota bacterium]